MGTPPTSTVQIPGDAERPVDEAARRRFEQAWRQGQRPALEAFLPPLARADFLGTLVELVQIDLEMAWKAGGDPALLPRVEDYARRFPSLNQPAILLDLVRQEYAVRQARGDAPHPDQYRARFPDIIRTGTELDDGATAGDDDAPSPRSPIEVPGYRILGKLGEGGMGVVYRARQLSLDRDVALKVISAGPAARAEDLARFRAEAALVAHVQHPNIVQVYEVGEAAGRPYLALELVAGGTLARRLADGPVPERQAAQWVAVLARAAHRLHTRGVVHRDLKPANVLFDLDGNLKVTDFGLAKRLWASDGATQVGSVLGTPSYASPEQAAGRAEAVGPAADVYALGAILYEMLTGRPPFRAASAVDTILQVLKDEPVSVTRLQPRVSPDLGTICHRCLQKEPARRYPSAEALADDLDRFLAGESILARPVSALGRLRRWARRNPALAITGALAGASLVAVVAVSLALAVQQSRAARQIAARQAQTEAALAEARARRTDAEQLTAGLLLDQAIALCQRGDVKAGLLWMARAMRAAPGESVDLRASVRVQLGAWGREVTSQRCPPLPHQGGVVAAAFSPDGTRVVTASEDKSARLWDAINGGPVARPMSHRAAVRVALFSPDGQVVLTAGDDGTAQRWDAAAGSPLGDPLRHEGAVTCAAFSPDGSTVVTGGADNAARLWRRADGQPIGTPLRAAGPVTAVAFSPDGKTFAAASQSLVILCDAASGQPIGQPLAHPQPVHAIAFAPGEGGTLAVGYGLAGAGGAALWDVSTARTAPPPPARTLPHGESVGALAFGPGGRLLVSGCDDGTTRVWDVPAGRLALPPLQGPRSVAVRCLAVRGDGRAVACGYADGSARLWDLGDGRPLGTSVSHADAVDAIALSPDGATLLTASEDKTARLWAVAPGQSAGPPVALPARPPVVAYDAMRRRRLVLRAGGDAIVEDATTGQPIGPPLAHDGPTPFERQVMAVALSPDGTVALTGGRDQTARLWDAATGQPRGGPLRHGALVMAVAFSPDGRSVATGGADKATRLWDAATGQPLGKPIPSRGPVAALAFAPDGRRLLVGCGYAQDRAWLGQARLWDLAAGASVGQAWHHSGPVTAVAFGPDGRVAATASVDHTCQLWQPATGRPLGPALAHPGEVIAAEFTADGTTLETCCAVRSADVSTPPTTAPATGPALPVVPADAYVALAWHVPAAPAAANDVRLETWVQVLTGLELDAANVVRRLDDATWLARRQQLDEAGGTP